MATKRKLPTLGPLGKIAHLIGGPFSGETLALRAGFPSQTFTAKGQTGFYSETKTVGWGKDCQLVSHWVAEQAVYYPVHGHTIQ